MADTPQPMPFEAFASTLRPQIASVRSIAPRNGPATTVNVMSKGHPDEVWLRWLKSRHGAEKHTRMEWQHLIDIYAKQAAHPADPNFRS